MSAQIDAIVRRANLDLSSKNEELNRAIVKLETKCREARTAIAAKNAILRDITGRSFLESQALEVSRLLAEVEVREAALAVAVAASAASRAES